VEVDNDLYSKWLLGNTIWLERVHGLKADEPLPQRVKEFHLSVDVREDRRVVFPEIGPTRRRQPASFGVIGRESKVCSQPGEIPGWVAGEDNFSD
jgi:hypothetical protein